MPASTFAPRAIAFPNTPQADNLAAVDSAAPTDETLIRSTLAGDDDAFAELARRHKPKIFAMAARFARNDHELDDICQEIFIRAWKHLASFRADAPFEHWLSRLAVRGCYDFLRKARRSREHDVPLDDNARNISAEEKPGARHARETLALAMSKLSPEEKLVITLLELEEKSVREIAALTGWSESNVKVRAFRARAALKRVIETHREK
jgi:RNA polymerase sigma-70 factor (ECF subfamily)